MKAVGRRTSDSQDREDLSLVGQCQQGVATCRCLQGIGAYGTLSYQKIDVSCAGWQDTTGKDAAWNEEPEMSGLVGHS